MEVGLDTPKASTGRFWPILRGIAAGRGRLQDAFRGIAGQPTGGREGENESLDFSVG